MTFEKSHQFLIKSNLQAARSSRRAAPRSQTFFQLYLPIPIIQSSTTQCRWLSYHIATTRGRAAAGRWLWRHLCKLSLIRKWWWFRRNLLFKVFFSSLYLSPICVRNFSVWSSIGDKCFICWFAIRLGTCLALFVFGRLLAQTATDCLDLIVSCT